MQNVQSTLACAYEESEGTRDKTKSERSKPSHGRWSGRCKPSHGRWSGRWSAASIASEENKRNTNRIEYTDRIEYTVVLWWYDRGW